MEMRNYLLLSCAEDDFIKNIVRILNERLLDRSCISFVKYEGQETTCKVLELDIDSRLGVESFTIYGNEAKRLKISGGDAKGLLYGVGKMLRTADYSGFDFEFGSWRGVSNPANSFRTIYFATHFFNFYHVAPLEKIRKYVEDLALWGYNGLMMWLDKHHYSSPEDPEYKIFAERLKKIYETGISVGMKPVIGALCNEGFSNTPEHLRAQHPGRSFYGCEICPSTEEGMQLILANHRDSLEKFFNFPEVGYSIWSYDQGGCKCEKCYPWGSEGMYRTAKQTADLVREHIQDAKIIYSTWLFDYKGEKEWENLYEKLHSEEKPWFDYLLADSHTDFPEYPLEHGKPKGIEMINFPEISMWRRFPWGGFGANPQPSRFSRLWGEACLLCSGGFPYSEGIFEDFNKVLYAGFYWDGSNETTETMKEYFNYEFGCHDWKKLMEAIDILEDNHKLLWYCLPSENLIYEDKRPVKNKPGVYAQEFGFKNASKAYDIVEDIDMKLPDWVRESWRWRILYIRIFCDYTLERNGGEPDAEMEKYLEELAKIYCCNEIGPENLYTGMDRVNPLTDKFIKDQKKRLCRKGESKQSLEIV